MIRCLRLVLIAMMATAMLSAQNVGAKDISLLGTVSDKLIMWFDSLSTSVDHIADKEDRQKLKKALISLNKSIYSLEENGRRLRSTLQRTPLDESAATKAVASTRDALAELGRQLHATGLALRSQYREGGAEAEKLISDAMTRRDFYLTEVESEIAKHKISAETEFASESVLNGQRTASIALGQVIDKIH